VGRSFIEQDEGLFAYVNVGKTGWTEREIAVSGDAKGTETAYKV